MPLAHDIGAEAQFDFDEALVRVAGVETKARLSPSGWRTRPRTCSAPMRWRTERPKGMILKIHTDSRGTYGAPRVHAELRLAHRVNCSQKRVARLMRSLGLEGVHRRRRRRTTVRSPKAAVAPDLVQRNFTASAPGQLLVADISYIPTLSGFLYLMAVAIDVFTRMVVGWAMANHLRTELALRAITMARERKLAPTCSHRNSSSLWCCDDRLIPPSTPRAGSPGSWPPTASNRVPSGGPTNSRLAPRSGASAEARALSGSRISR